MTDYYSDPVNGSALNSGLFGFPKDRIEDALAVMAPGDRLFLSNNDVQTGDRTFTALGIISNPISIIGLNTDAPSNPPTVAQIAKRGTDVLPQVTTGVGFFDITTAGFANVVGVDFECGDRLFQTGQQRGWNFDEIECTFGGSIRCANVFYNTSIECDGGGFFFSLNSEFHNCDWTFPTQPSILCNSIGPFFFSANDLAGFGTGTIHSGSLLTKTTLINCKVPLTYTPASTFNNLVSSVEIIGSNNDAVIPDDSAIPDYYYEDYHGVVIDDTLIYRNGGGEYGGVGNYSYALTSNGTGKEGTDFGIRCRRFQPVWLEGGTTYTLTIYIANSAAENPTNLLDISQVKVNVLHPNETDTTQYGYSALTTGFEKYLSDTLTIITPDFLSTWQAGANNAQLLSVSVTPAYTGFAAAEIVYSTDNVSAPILYFDPKIDVA